MAKPRTLSRPPRFIYDDDSPLGCYQIREPLLGSPGVRLLASKSARLRRYGKREVWTADLIRYKAPDVDRPSYIVILWTGRGPGSSWETSDYFVAAEARVHYDTWGRMPKWWRRPPILERMDREASEVTDLVRE